MVGVMNLIEARKLGHEGWVRSPTRSNGEWCRPENNVWTSADFSYQPMIHVADIDAEDWEPKPKPFESWVWAAPDGKLYPGAPVDWPGEQYGWRKILVREVE